MSILISSMEVCEEPVFSLLIWSPGAIIRLTNQLKRLSFILHFSAKLVFDGRCASLRYQPSSARGINIILPCL